MAKEWISLKAGVALTAMFIIGSTLVVGGSSEAQQDAWISVLLAMALALPLLMLYARLVRIFPGEDIFTVAHRVYGSWIGKTIALFIAGYAFLLGTLVLRDFAEFLTAVSMVETPKYVIELSMALLCIWLIKAGIEVLGRWMGLVFTLIVISITVTFSLAFSIMQFSHLQPILYRGIKPVLAGTYATIAFPFAETFLFTAVFSTLKRGASPYKVYFLGLLLGGFLLISGVIANIAILGFPSMETQYFPSYIAISVIHVGLFLQRIEVVVSTVFLLTGLAKASVCLYCASKGIAKILNLDDYRMIVPPIGLLMFNLSIFIFGSIQELYEWTQIYNYFVIPFQIVLPLIIWIGAELKVHRQTV